MCKRILASCMLDKPLSQGKNNVVHKINVLRVLQAKQLRKKNQLLVSTHSKPLLRGGLLLANN